MRNGPVFLSLNRPYKGLTATGIANILNKSIELVGLKSQGFSAKCFRPSGATSAVEAGVNPDFITSVAGGRTIRCLIHITYMLNHQLDSLTLFYALINTSLYLA